MGESLAEATGARHTGTLPTPYYEKKYGLLSAEGLDAIANALHDIADKLRLNPHSVLAKAFQPATIGMDPTFAAVFEIGYIPGVPQKVVVKGMARVVQAEICFRVMWTASVGKEPPNIEPLLDNSMGG